jgi:hypothetical protein
LYLCKLKIIKTSGTIKMAQSIDTPLFLPFKKLVIKDLVLYADEKRAATKK